MRRSQGIAELRKICAYCTECVGQSWVSLLHFVRASVAAIVPIFKILHAKSRAFRPQICAIAAPNVRASHMKCAQTHSKHFRRHATLSSASREAFAGAGRVSRPKTAPKFIETSASSTENHGFWIQNFEAKGIAELRKNCASCAECVGQSWMSLLHFVRASVAAIVPIF